MKEHELAFVFTHEDADIFLSQNKIKESHETFIRDWYLSQNVRVRTYEPADHKNVKYVITQKTGEKSDTRIEFEHEISKEAADTLVNLSSLYIDKNRFTLLVTQNCTYTIDYIFSPMRLAIIEIEQNGGDIDAYRDEISKSCFANLRSCSLSTYKLFKRKIGICGAPSSGKTEFAKHLSWILNTKLGAHSFCTTEYATTFIQKYNRTPNILDQFFIWLGQTEREKSASSRANIVISDCPTFLSYLYTLDIVDKMSDINALYLSKIYKRVLLDLRTYTDFIYLKLNEYRNNYIRFHTYGQAMNISHRIENFLTEHKIQYQHAQFVDVEKTVDNLFCLNRI